MKKTVCLLILACAGTAVFTGLRQPEREQPATCSPQAFAGSPFAGAISPVTAIKPVCAESPQTVIEGIKRSARKNRRIFSAAQFICILPMDAPALTTVCTQPEEAVAAVLRMKREGCEEIRLRSPASGPVYDAIMRTAKEQDIRVNV